MVPNTAVTAALPRLGERVRERGLITCNIAAVVTKTHRAAKRTDVPRGVCRTPHQFLPLIRTEVSSAQTTGLLLGAVFRGGGRQPGARGVVVEWDALP